jgi:stage II sporulation protein AA (anti-sigma F factor antagonist)
MFTVLSKTPEELCVAIAGEIDHHTAAMLRDGIDEEIEALHPKRLTLDFGRVTFMDSSGIGLVMGRYRLMQPYGGTVGLVNVPTPLRKVMRVAGLDRLAQFEEGGIPHESV